MNRENRKYLKKLGIRVSGKQLGRPKESESYYEKAQKKKEHNQRNHIEGKFGQGKNGYELNKIRARRQDTSESWIATIFFVMNIVRLEKLTDIFYLLILRVLKRWKNVENILRFSLKVNGSLIYQ